MSKNQDDDLSHDPRMDRLAELLDGMDPTRVEQLMTILEHGDVEQLEELQVKEETADE